MVRDYGGNCGNIIPPTRTEIQSFSDHSRRRLKFKAANAFPALISQFGMTYHLADPDGLTVKSHLNAFLTLLRKKFTGTRYLWILEFQSRGTVHFHLFTDLEHSTETGKALGTIWHRIAEPGSPEHLKFHCHPKNFIPWDMGSGSYLCKYLDKQAQKAVPDGFVGVGRFWGCSRDLVPEPMEIEMSGVKAELGDTAGKSIIRTLCKHHEKSLRKSPWRSSARTRCTSYTLPNGAIIVNQLFQSFLNKKLPF